MKNTVIYHSADFDGRFCEQIARKFMPNAEFIGWNFGDDKLEFPSEGEVFVLDLSPDCFATEELIDYERLVWIDHHKSSIEKWDEVIPGYRIDGVAACRLAWQWFTWDAMAKLNWGMPIKDKFFDRKVSEPWAVRLAGEYDIWDKRDTDAELFQHGLRSENVDFDLLLSDGADATVMRLLNQGRALQYARTKENESIIKELGFTFEWQGLKWLACNAARYNSLLFTAGLTPKHDACFGFKWTGKNWSVSLYHAPGMEHHDLSKIAVQFGGGGHAGACGFQIDKLPFL